MDFSGVPGSFGATGQLGGRKRRFDSSVTSQNVGSFGKSRRTGRGGYGRRGGGGGRSGGTSSNAAPVTGGGRCKWKFDEKKAMFEDNGRPVPDRGGYLLPNRSPSPGTDLPPEPRVAVVGRGKASTLPAWMTAKGKGPGRGDDKELPPRSSSHRPTGPGGQVALKPYAPQEQSRGHGRDSASSKADVDRPTKDVDDKVQSVIAKLAAQSGTSRRATGRADTQARPTGRGAAYMASRAPLSAAKSIIGPEPPPDIKAARGQNRPSMVPRQIQGPERGPAGAPPVPGQRPAARSSSQAKYPSEAEAAASYGSTGYRQTSAQANGRSYQGGYAATSAGYTPPTQVPASAGMYPAAPATGYAQAQPAQPQAPVAQTEWTPEQIQAYWQQYYYQYYQYYGYYPQVTGPSDQGAAVAPAGSGGAVPEIDTDVAPGTSYEVPGAPGAPGTA